MNKIILDIKTNANILSKVVLSDGSTEIKKVVVRPVLIKGDVLFQIERYKGTQVFHENVGLDNVLGLPFVDYKQILVEKVGESTIYSKGKSAYRAKAQANKIKSITTTHNKEKEYILNEGENIPAFVELGIFNRDLKIVKSMYDKFKQINRFIEIVDDAYKDYTGEEITILDFGCGKSYLTFIIYYYFVVKKGVKAKIIGYDLKADVVKNCNEIAKRYGYDGLEFHVSDVGKDELYKDKIDMIIALHACDTATDYALNFAIQNGVRQIFSVPCCQHEINQSIKDGGDYDLFLSDGLFKERFSALLTDAVRVDLLRAYGYSTDVIEFVDFAHSPKNLMIRAAKNKKANKNFKKVKELQQKYHFKQKLLELLSKDA